MDTKAVNSIGELVDTLGGLESAAAVLGVKSAQVVSNWKNRSERIPPEYFMQHQEALKQRGIVAPPSLWFGGAA